MYTYMWAYTNISTDAHKSMHISVSMHRASMHICVHTRIHVSIEVCTLINRIEVMYTKDHTTEECPRHIYIRTQYT